MTTETTVEGTFATAAELLAAIQPAEGGREIKDPATGELVGRVAEPGCRRAGRRGRVRPLRTARVGCPRPRRAKPVPEPGRRRGGGERRGAGRAALARAGQAAERAERPVRGRCLRGAGCAPPPRSNWSRKHWWRKTATHAELHYRPLGVVGAIGPWNWPMMITHLAAGSGAADGQHRGDEALRVHAAVRAGAGRSAQHRAAGRRAARGSGRPRGGRGARPRTRASTRSCSPVPPPPARPSSAPPRTR